MEVSKWLASLKRISRLGLVIARSILLTTVLSILASNANHSCANPLASLSVLRLNSLLYQPQISYSSRRRSINTL